MVDYATWVSVVFEMLEDRNVSVSFDGGGTVVQAAAIVWNNDKSEIKAMSRSEAQAHAEAEIEVT